MHGHADDADAAAIAFIYIALAYFSLNFAIDFCGSTPRTQRGHALEFGRFLPAVGQIPERRRVNHFGRLSEVRALILAALVCGTFAGCGSTFSYL